jgi:predicted extracellular nuclease
MQQRQKLVAAIAELDAHVVGLIEIENSPSDFPIADLVAAINAVSGAGTYTYVPTGAIGDDAIRVGFIYQPASVSLENSFAVLDSSVDPTFNDDKNRPVLAQTFSDNRSDEWFTVAVNHLKSKGSPCDDVGDPDTGDLQGNCNGVRTAAAAALVNWLATDPTGTECDNILILGDLNAYTQEDPVSIIESAGYIDLVEAYVGTGVGDGAYSFNFFSESGSLDHALSSPALAAHVTGAAIWHINADEPRALDYNDFNQPALFSDDEFRSSDHDPVVIGLLDDGDHDGVADVVDYCPGTHIPESVPTIELKDNRWALIDDDLVFDTTTEPSNGDNNDGGFTTVDTAGCSCEQIIWAQGLGKRHKKFGCSTRVMRRWVKLVTP